MVLPVRQGSSATDRSPLRDSRCERCCAAPSSTFTQKWSAAMNTGKRSDALSRLHSTIGGSSETEAKELTVTPTFSPSEPCAVTTHTPVAKWPKALRKARESWDITNLKAPLTA